MPAPVLIGVALAWRYADICAYADWQDYVAGDELERMGARKLSSRPRKVGLCNGHDNCDDGSMRHSL